MLSAFLKTIAGAQCAVLAQGGEPERGFWVLLLYYLAACGGGFLLFRAVSLGLKPVPVKGRDKASLAAFLFALGLSSGFEALFGLREAFCAEVGFLPRSSGLPAVLSMATFALAWYAALLPIHARRERAPFPPKYRFLLRVTAVPFAVMIGLELMLEAARLLPLEWQKALAAVPLGGIAPEAAGFAAMVLFIPPLAAAIWGARPLDDPFLLPRLRTIAARAGLPGLRILLWRTQGAHYHNAVAMGTVRPLSFVMLSDGIVEDFPPPWTEAIFAHETIHSRQRHVLLLLAGMTGAIALMAGIAFLLPGNTGLSVGLGSLLFYVMVVVGPLMRNLEREADVMGSMLLDDPLEMARALEHLKNYAPPRKWKHSFTHFGLNERVEVVERCAADRTERGRVLAFSRRVVYASLAAAALCGAFGLWVVFSRPSEVVAEQWLSVYWVCVERELPGEGLACLERALEAKDDPEVRMLYGLTCLELGRLDEAARVLRETEDGGRYREMLERELKRLRNGPRGP